MAAREPRAFPSARGTTGTAVGSGVPQLPGTMGGAPNPATARCPCTPGRSGRPQDHRAASCGSRGEAASPRPGNLPPPNPTAHSAGVSEGIMRAPSNPAFARSRPHTLAIVCAAFLLIGTALGVARPAQAAEDAVLARGADLCAHVGDQAGFRRDDRLVLAVAIGLAESGCNPGASHRNGSHGCRGGSIDR